MRVDHTYLGSFVIVWRDQSQSDDGRRGARSEVGVDVVVLANLRHCCGQ